MSSTATAPTKEELAEEILSQSFADQIEGAEIVGKSPNPSAPISIRLRAQLLKKIYRIAAAECRSRSNLIQLAL